MDYKDWQKLAKITAQELNKGNNVIITHGTDTLHYTSAALSFMLKGKRPVVLTAAQRSPDRGSSDAATNLVCSIHAALSDLGEIGICMHGSMNDDFCSFNRATRVRKMHTTRRDTFKTFEDEFFKRFWCLLHLIKPAICTCFIRGILSMYSLPCFKLSFFIKTCFLMV